MFNFFKKTFNFNTTSTDIYNTARYLFRGTENDINRNLKPEESLQYANKISTLGDIVNKVLTPIKNIKPYVINKKTQEIIEKKEVIDFLNKPNDEQDYSDFIWEICFQKLMCNNVFLEKIGIKNHIIELYPVKPGFIDIDGNGKELNYTIEGSEYYSFLNGSFKGKNNVFSEINSSFKTLYHFKGMTGETGYYGTSPLDPILFEIELSKAINDYNISILSNGVTLSGVLSIDSNNPDDLKRLRDDVAKNISGTRNAGKFLSTLGKSIDFKTFGATNKDMSFEAFIERSEERIYSEFGIPLPLIKQDSLTYNNYETANYILMINLILPLLDEVFDYLTILFKDNNLLNEEEEINYNEKEIPILKMEHLQNIKALDGLATVNEMRLELGMNIKPEYDVLLVPVNKMNIKNIDKIANNDPKEANKDEKE